MKVGDYVRTDRGIIAKIIRINTTGSITCDRSVYFGFNIVNSKRTLCNLSKIIKSDPKLINLVQVGDYVNGCLVLDIAQAPIKALYLNDISQKGALIPVCENDIKSTVTKEQFESMKYEVN